MEPLRQFLETTLEQMIQLQKQKVLKLAREIEPGLTPEDIRNPQDIPALYQDPFFNYEDGILAGYLAVQMAGRALVQQAQEPQPISPNPTAARTP